MANQAIHAFLRKLATDAAFRAAVEHDPIVELAALGIKVDPKDLPPEGIKLPSNASILQNLDHLAERVESTAGEIFFCL
jgi:hypothetical protein